MSCQAHVRLSEIAASKQRRRSSDGRQEQKRVCVKRPFRSHTRVYRNKLTVDTCNWRKPQVNTVFLCHDYLLHQSTLTFFRSSSVVLPRGPRSGPMRRLCDVFVQPGELLEHLPPLRLQNLKSVEDQSQSPSVGQSVSPADYPSCSHPPDTRVIYLLWCCHRSPEPRGGSR